ncbi:hypothetical protein HDU97_005384 [Phlyctochytrium planicorne]|nr:hypothetical protein HDU97_005384 [Phlyctochytrium planicorne]
MYEDDDIDTTIQQQEHRQQQHQIHYQQQQQQQPQQRPPSTLPPIPDFPRARTARIQSDASDMTTNPSDSVPIPDRRTTSLTPYNIVSINHDTIENRRRSSVVTMFTRIKGFHSKSTLQKGATTKRSSPSNTFGRKIVFNPNGMSRGSFNYEEHTSRRSTEVFQGRLRQFLRPVLEAYAAFSRKISLIVFGNSSGTFIDNTVKTARYSVVDFLPKQIIIQFSKFANLYFFFISMLQIVPGWSPTGQFTTIFPLSIFVALAMIKEAWEDYLRHKQDQAENNLLSRKLHIGSIHASSQSQILHDTINEQEAEEGHGNVRKPSEFSRELSTRWQELLWKDIKVGDILLIQDGDIVPADVVVLFSSHQNGSCFIETSNLDGESNLKQKQALPAAQRFINGQDSFAHLSYEIEAEPPSGNLSQFEGYIDLKTNSEGRHTLTASNFIPRGTTLINTNFIFAVVIYSGEETKIRKNAAKSHSNKVPSLEKTTNGIVQIMFIAVLVLTTVTTILSAVWENFENRGSTRHWYLNFQSDTTATFFSYLILYNNMIPISLYVAMELVKLMGVFFINSDLQMYDSSTDTAAQSRTSNLHEDLGQVQYVFTDKTGTLTQNIMMFRKLSVSGLRYAHGEKQDDHRTAAAIASTQKAMKSELSLSETESLTETLIKELTETVKKTDSEVDLRTKTAFNFLLAIALCHTVEPSKKNPRREYNGAKFQNGFKRTQNNGVGVISAEDMGIDYQSSSPDEVALANAAREMSFVLRGRTMTTLTLNTLFSQKDTTYDLLQIIEFSSHRKRMSSIYRYPDGRIVLICKGADSVILERLKTQEKMTEEEQQDLDQTLLHLASFASEGLRTLLYASRELTQDEYEKWSKEWESASLAIKNRAAAMEGVAELIESELTLLGATAIEDKLQVGVPDTIEKLRRAGIKVWMLTGDKKETAINIGYTCNLAHKHSKILLMDGHDMQSVSKSLSENQKIVERVVEKNIQRAATITDGKPDPQAPLHSVIVIDGATLQFLEEDEIENQKGSVKRQSTQELRKPRSLLDKFLDVAVQCDGVICCRFSPSQKALLVSKVRERTSLHGGDIDVIDANKKKPHFWSRPHTSGVTLAIGDGANDIPMLQSAHVGIGITGREGLAASRASDYSIAQFRYLQPLLFVHGHWSYVRVCLFTLGTFYKCLTFYLTQALFQFVTGWSATSLYESWSLALYNIFFSSLPVITIGVFEKDLNKSTLLGVPELYRYGQYNRGLNIRIFLLWMLEAVWHSIIAVLVPILMFGGVCVSKDSQCLHGSIADCFCSDMNVYQESSIYSLGNLSYTILVLLVNFKVSYIESHNWTIFTHISFAASLILWWIFGMIYSKLSDMKIPGMSQVGLETASQFEATQQGTTNQLRYWVAQLLAFVVSFVLFDLAQKVRTWKYDSVTNSLTFTSRKGKVFAADSEALKTEGRPSEAKMNISHKPSVLQRKVTTEMEPGVSGKPKQKKRKPLSNSTPFTHASVAADQFAKSIVSIAEAECGGKTNSKGTKFDWAASIPLWQLWEQQRHIHPEQDAGKDILHLIVN